MYVVFVYSHTDLAEIKRNNNTFRMLFMVSSIANLPAIQI